MYRKLSDSAFSARAVYDKLHDTLMAIDEHEDLRWWKNTHGPGMPTDWPHFQVSAFLKTFPFTQLTILDSQDLVPLCFLRNGRPR